MATNTVPIEIVLQGPNNPIVPDTPGDDPGENTNISVPDTALGTGGYTTKDGSSTGNIFTGSNAVVSIVSIVVLVLVIGAIVTLLVRRYQKHKKNAKGEEAEAKVSKGEKLATVATATLAVLAATVLVGQVCMTATNAATSEGGTTLTTPDKIQIIANRYEDVTIVASAKTVSYATTDTSFGYKIFMSMAGESANLYLNGNTSSEYYFAPTENAGLDDNSWGYSLTGKANYSAMPLVDDPTMAQQNTSAVQGDEFTVYYTMKADKDMPFGVYSGEITYNIEGQVDFPANLTTMQGMSSEICDATYTPNAFKADGVTIEGNVPTKTLTDTRDGKTYTVAKLADGKCWMTQNLDLQKENLLAGVTLDSTNTDNPTNGFVLPDSQKTGSDSWRDDGSETAYNTAHVYDLNGNGETYKYCMRDRYDNCEEYGDDIPATKLGNLYNWYAATAGTGTYDTGGEGSEDAAGSICPANWRLPNNSSSRIATDYSTLLARYGIIESPTSPAYAIDNHTAYYEAPLSFVPAGYYNGTTSYAGLKGIGVLVILQSSLAASNSDAYYLQLSPSEVQPWKYEWSKWYGFAVRCVAR